MSVVISTTDSKSGMSKVEYETRVSLAACARLMAHYRLTDLTNGLIAARLRDQPDFCLVNRFGDFFEEITAIRLQKRPIHYSDAAAEECLVAFSCRRRGFCPSCGACRMVASAAQLVDKVLPHEPVRQWVLSFPFQLRFLFTNRYSSYTPR